MKEKCILLSAGPGQGEKNGRKRRQTERRKQHAQLRIKNMYKKTKIENECTKNEQNKVLDKNMTIKEKEKGKKLWNKKEKI